MTKNVPAAPDATLTLLTVAEASEASPQEGTIFDDLSLLGALLFGEPISEALSMRSRPNAGTDWTQKKPPRGEPSGGFLHSWCAQVAQRAVAQ